MSDVKRWVADTPHPNQAPPHDHQVVVVDARDYDLLAAENARLREAGGALADLIVKEEDGMGREWYELASHWREVEIALSEWRAALSPERTTGEGE